MKDLFKIEGFSEREAVIAQLITCLTMGEKDSRIFQDAISYLKLNDNHLQALGGQLSALEKELTTNDESLSDLLANASKSTCCS